MSGSTKLQCPPVCLMATTLRFMDLRIPISFKFFPIHSFLGLISIIYIFSSSSKKSLKADEYSTLAERSPPSPSGSMTLSAPTFFKMEVIRSVEDFATTKGTPCSFATETAKMLAPRFFPMAVTTMSMFLSPREFTSSSFKRLAQTAEVQFGAISLTFSSFSSTARTSAPRR